MTPMAMHSPAGPFTLHVENPRIPCPRCDNIGHVTAFSSDTTLRLYCASNGYPSYSPGCGHKWSTPNEA